MIWKKTRISCITVCLTVILLVSVVVPVQALETHGVEDSWMILNGERSKTSDFESWEDAQEIKVLASGKKELTNHSAGYKLQYPASMKEDFSLSAVRGVLENDVTKLEIYHDQFSGTNHSANSYINYSRGFLQNRQDHHLRRQEVLQVNGMTVHYLEWDRTPIKAIENDRHHYAKAIFLRNSMEVYTLLFKSQEPMKNHWDIIESFELVDRKATPKLHQRYYPMDRDWSLQTQAFYQQYFIDSDELIWGIFEYSAPGDFADLFRLERRLEYEFPFLLHYKNFEREFPRQELENAREEKRNVVLTLQTKHREDEKNRRVLYDVLEGKHDDHIDMYARELKDFGEPVLFRLNNEMNGDWCVYSAYFSSMDTDIFVASWRYIYERFEKHDLDNVIWVWNPHDLSFPGFQWNHYLMYYPGDEYVDIIGMTGYNPGTYFPGERWKSFVSIYADYYEEYSMLFQQPLMIPEFGSSSVGGDKIAWIWSMFYHMPRYEDIKVAIWWNGIDRDEEGNPGRIYRLDETPEMVETFRKGLSRFTSPEPAWRDAVETEEHEEHEEEKE
ncbi:Glycosyl hydrolase family 26 [Tindallia magadiensis]|uniref:Glycosyl hydrolase family 26 n=1 Tax=Tindallia magadiensis TaxID=69895 RepID=A0A1I3E5F2_9FIRM|nr:glycosyl hydrolase [Tindallia magadiensis]SFH94217.1 Glycosyl hydrolase family 26 [Tindallia magadiensis]